MAEKLGRFVHAVRPRITELKAMGLLRQRGEVWHEQTQRHEAVWELAAPKAEQLSFA